MSLALEKWVLFSFLARQARGQALFTQVTKRALLAPVDPGLGMSSKPNTTLVNHPFKIIDCINFLNI